MNTLNYKALLIKTSWLIFIRALGLYLLGTLPFLFEPIIYLVSAGFVLVFGWIAGILFNLLFWLLYKINADLQTKCIALCTAVLVSVIAAFQALEITGAFNHIWQSGEFLLFPLAAVVAGWISMAISRQQVSFLLSREHKTNNDIISSTHETVY